MKPLLSVHNLCVTFSPPGKAVTKAVTDLCFSLYPGEAVALVGESGSGKSVTARSLIGLLPEGSAKITGEVLFEGKNLLTLEEKKQQKIRGAKIGMIFQDPMTSLNPTMRIIDQVIEGYLYSNKSSSRKMAVEKALLFLEKVGMSRAKSRVFGYPNALSGGMKQRALIASALLPSPSLLIADEPTTALDVTVQASVLDTLKKLQTELCMTILLITHDLSIVAGFCDRVLVMHEGKIVESAPTNQLFYHPAHPYTKKLLRSII